MEEQRLKWRRDVQAVTQSAVQHPQQTSARLITLLAEIQQARERAPDDIELQLLEARARFAEATVYAQEGRLRIARQIFSSIKDDFQALDEPVMVARCLNALSVVSARQGDQETALRLLEQCFHHRQRYGAPPEQLAHTLMNIGITQAVLNDHHTALDTLQFAEELFGEDRIESRGVIQTNRALLHRALDAHDQCVSALDAALVLLEPLGASIHLINALVERAVDDIRLGALPIGRQRLERARSMLVETGAQFMEPECRLIAARLCLAEGNPAMADAEIAAALPVATAEQRWRLLSLRAEAAEASGDWQSALRWLRSAHAEKMALVDEQYQARLATAQARATTTVEEEKRRWLRAELQQAQSEAQALAERLHDQKSMLAATAHDINNPLSIVLLLGELASEDPEMLLESADSIVKAARHMQSLVSQLIATGDQSAAAPVLSLGPLDVRTLLSQAQARYLPIASAKAQTLRLLCESSVQTIEGDRSAVDRVLDNLISNAIKYTPPGGTIDLRAHHQGERVCVEVLDTGPGLSPADLERVFFYPERLSAVPTSGEPQHGLGLVSVRQLMNAMGGRVYAENRLRGGARFVVELLASS